MPGPGDAAQCGPGHGAVSRVQRGEHGPHCHRSPGGGAGLAEREYRDQADARAAAVGGDAGERAHRPTLPALTPPP